MSPSIQWPVASSRKRQQRRARRRSARRGAGPAHACGLSRRCSSGRFGRGHPCISAQPDSSVQQHGILTCDLDRDRSGPLRRARGRARPGRARQRAPQAPHGARADHRHRRIGAHHRRRLRVRAAAHRELRRGLGRRQDALLAVARRARARNRPQPGHVRTAARRGAARPAVSARRARHPGVHGALDGRTGRCRRRHGDVVRDAAGLGLQRPPGRARRRRHGCLEPVRDPRLPDHRGRRRRRRGRIEPHPRDRRDRRARHLRSDRRGVRRRPLERAARAPDRRPGGPPRDAGPRGSLTRRR